MPKQKQGQDCNRHAKSQSNASGTLFFKVSIASHGEPGPLWLTLVLPALGVLRQDSG